jgi:DNA-binding NarL/FixJ family response regulator
MPKLVIVDDSDVVRRSIRQFLAYEDASWKICGEARDADEGFRLCVTLEPTVALIDLTLTPVDGLSLVRRLKKTGITTKIILMSEQGPGILEMVAETYGILALPKSRLATRLMAVLAEALSQQDR